LGTAKYAKIAKNSRREGWAFISFNLVFVTSVLSASPCRSP
jgi:hypothetical protein